VPARDAAGAIVEVRDVSFRERRVDLDALRSLPSGSLARTGGPACADPKASTAATAGAAFPKLMLGLRLS